MSGGSRRVSTVVLTAMTCSLLKTFVDLRLDEDLDRADEVGVVEGEVRPVDVGRPERVPFRK